MRTILSRLGSFFLSVLLLFGMLGETVAEKTASAVDEIDFSGADVSDGYTVTLPASAGSVRFNRVCFNYEASAAVRAVFHYKQGIRTCEEELLLSAKAARATMLLDGYLRRRTASRLLSVYFEPIVSGTECVLSVSDFVCAVQNMPKHDTLYLENDRFRAGVSLKWGGGLCSFEDKRNDRYGNLLNSHDTGRLVQQSYYGPTQIDGYENGIYEKTVWPYNPVQGGDQYGNNSKLVAVEQTDNEIRVVCRPLDWALNNVPTMAYYTNIYTLTDTGLAVQNTVVDFLQTEWTPKSQELPAFYTISALGSFRFYDGDKPWTDDALRREDDLGFWSGKPAFPLRQGNTETWCAWTDGSGYGIGLYTPQATSLLAGRFEYDGSADANGNPTNYVAPLDVFRLTFDEPYTYDYYLTTGNVNEIRSVFRHVWESGKSAG